MPAVERKPFSKEIEERPGLTMRRLTPEELAKYDHLSPLGTSVGIFNVYGNKKLLAVVDFDDLFDTSGIRFYND